MGRDEGTGTNDGAGDGVANPLASPFLWEGVNAGELDALMAAAELVNDAGSIEWLPEYGCAIVARASDFGVRPGIQCLSRQPLHTSSRSSFLE